MSAAIRKYQVFVSSTFSDLKDTRESITWELLKSDFIPVGMENFSAEDGRGWDTIERAIDSSDYYVLLIAGMYGSTDNATGLGWTEREYDYAKARGVPVLSFVRDLGSVPGDKVDTGDKRARLDAFIKKVEASHLREKWTTEDDLRAKVPIAILKQANRDEADGKARPGWYRGPVSGVPLDEIAKLSAENRDLRAQLAAAPGVPKVLAKLQALPQSAPIDVRCLSLNGVYDSVLNGAFTIESISEPDNSLQLKTFGRGSGAATVVTFPIDKLDTLHKGTTHWELSVRPFR
jgi:hypothetical protein